jgi:hypothetical protein
MQQNDGKPRNERYFQKPENWISFLTLIAVAIYTGVQIYQTSLIYKNYVVSERASVSVSTQPGITSGNPATNTITGYIFIIDIANSGNTATKDLKVFTKCAPSPEDLKEPWSVLYQGPELEHFPQFVGAHAILKTSCGFSIDQLQDMASHKLFGYIMVDISYYDRLNDDTMHRTQATFKISQVAIQLGSPGQVGQSGGLPIRIDMALETRGQHNCADEECDRLK